MHNIILSSCHGRASTEYGDHRIGSVMDEECVNVDSAFATDQIQQPWLLMYGKHHGCLFNVNYGVCMQVTRPIYYGDACECDNFNCPSRSSNGQVCNG